MRSAGRCAWLRRRCECLDAAWLPRVNSGRTRWSGLLQAVAVCHSKTMNNDTAPTEHTPEQQAALERLNIAQNNLVKARAAYEKAAEGLKAIEAFNEAMKPLMAYYDNGWLADVNATDSIYERPEAAGEDEIWNMHGGQYELMRELLAISSQFFVQVPEQVPGEEEDN